MQPRLFQSITGIPARNPSVLPRLHHPQFYDRLNCRFQIATLLPEYVLGHQRRDSSTNNFMLRDNYHI